MCMCVYVCVCVFTYILYIMCARVCHAGSISNHHQLLRPTNPSQQANNPQYQSKFTIKNSMPAVFWAGGVHRRYS